MYICTTLTSNCFPADSVNYFVTGKGDMEAYDPECLFADPFAGFNGVDRFKQNVSNLGGLMYAPLTGLILYSP